LSRGLPGQIKGYNYIGVGAGDGVAICSKRSESRRVVVDPHEVSRTFKTKLLGTQMISG